MRFVREFQMECSYMQRSAIDPFEPFDRLLEAVVLACDQLGVAVRHQHDVHAEIAADNATSSWLAARSVLHQLAVDGTGSGPRHQIADYALQANRRAILALVDGVYARMGSPASQEVLARLRVALASDHIASTIEHADRHYADLPAPEREPWPTAMTK
ncbi:MAG TPA: hypothetical protein VH165_32730 [Kofleriaceae bacterium]|nr:hypothetical protein [Kofleriaceae bacterium]